MVLRSQSVLVAIVSIGFFGVYAGLLLEDLFFCLDGALFSTASFSRVLIFTQSSPLMRIGYLLLLLMLSPLGLQAQDDNVLWAGVAFTSQLDDKATIQFKPFYRAQSDFSEYQNSSLDLSVRRQFGKGWYGQVLGRTWFIPDRKIQQFLWLDIGHKKDFGAITMTNYLRLHYAMLNNTALAGDFLRYKVSFAPRVKGPIKPSFAFEPWWQLNGVHRFERYRIEPGLKFIINPNMNIGVVWMRQNHIIPKFQQNLWVVLTSFKL